MTNQTSITLDEYAALEEPEGSRYELSKGELIVHPRPVPATIRFATASVRGFSLFQGSSCWVTFTPKRM